MLMCWDSLGTGKLGDPLRSHLLEEELQLPDVELVFYGVVTNFSFASYVNP